MKRTVNILSAIGRHFISLQKGVIIASSIFLVALVFTEVMLRYVFKAPIFGTDELAIMVAVWVYFIGVAHCTYTRSHIEGGLVSIISQKKLFADSVRLVVLLLTLACCVVFTLMSYEWCLWTIENEVTTTSLLLPTIYGEVAILIGAILMDVYFAIEVAEVVRRLRQRRKGV